jgi:hypothetical protein
MLRPPERPEFHNAWAGLDKDLSAPPVSEEVVGDFVDAGSVLDQELRSAAQDLRSAMHGHDLAHNEVVERQRHSSDPLFHESALSLVESVAPAFEYQQLTSLPQLAIENYPQVVYRPLQDLPHYFDYIGSAGDLSLVLLDRFE